MCLTTTEDSAARARPLPRSERKPMNRRQAYDRLHNPTREIDQTKWSQSLKTDNDYGLTEIKLMSDAQGTFWMPGTPGSLGALPAQRRSSLGIG